MPRTLTLACIQFTPSDDVQDNIDRVAERVREAAEQGADVVLPPELFAGYYFCKTQEEQHFARAYPWREHPAVEQLSGRISQEPHSGRAGLSGKILFPPRRYRVSRMGHNERPDWCGNLLGPMVPGSCARHGANGRGCVAVPHSDWR